MSLSPFGSAIRSCVAVVGDQESFLSPAGDRHHPISIVNAPMDLAADEDAQLVARVKAGDRSAFERLMRRHNQRLFRAIRSVLRNDAEVEDVMQDAYCAAFVHLD